MPVKTPKKFSVVRKREARMKCNTLPPTEIYDVLHEFEACGIELPQSVSDWWETETLINEEKRIKSN